MTTLEKLIFCKEHGISLTYIANKTELAPATITRWIRGEKGMTEKNQRHIEIILQNLAKEIWEKIGEEYDRNL